MYGTNMLDLYKFISTQTHAHTHMVKCRDVVKCKEQYTYVNTTCFPSFITYFIYRCLRLTNKYLQVNLKCTSSHRDMSKNN